MKPVVALVALLLASPLAADEFTVFASGGKSINSYHGQDDIQSFNVEWVHRRWRQTDVGASIGSEFLWQSTSWFGGIDHAAKEKVRGLNASLVARHYFEAHPHVYAELSTGPMWSERQVPANTSRFNFLSQGGIGVIVGARWQTPVMLGVRFAHISNAGLARHNPGINFTSVVMGLRFRP